MPKCEGMKNFPNKEDDLPQLPVKEWKQFIFTSIDPKIQFDDLFLDIEKRVGWMPIESFQYRKELSKEYIFNANWALYCDNYLEGFHIPFVHSDLNAVLDFENYDVEIFKYGNHLKLSLQIMIFVLIYQRNLLIMEKKLPLIISGFPNMMFNFYPWGLSLNIVVQLQKQKQSYFSILYMG